MLSFPSVAEAYRPDPPSPAGVNFYYLPARTHQHQKKNGGAVEYVVFEWQKTAKPLGCRRQTW